ncbi:peptidase inhibitor I9 [Nocardioides albertanoniae]|uniref:Peptidase inhibitor I9 n=1 Tax=Nocardioides albertanoniae TaxID=1175486 RepID=A0A543AAE4_9ACTN|nr:S8 family peptidase [Nocardioides albertanoniae]TQL69573.1 peptidase inhibitor I9 [Nocardioides albertanoniae]
MNRTKKNRAIKAPAVISAVAVGAAASAIAFTVPAGAADSQAPLRGENASTAIDGQYIVVMKKQGGSDVATTEAKSVRSDARSAGGDVRTVFDKAFNGFSATLDKDALAEVRSNPDVAYVQANHRYTTQGDQADPTWGLDRVDQAELPLDKNYHYDQTGKGVTAYIIDTGVATDHPEFEGRIGEGFDAVDGDTDPTDGNGHGTHVAGTVAGTTYGLAKEATIVPVRVLDDQGSGTTEGVVAGIEWVTENHTDGPAVANMSLGGGADTALDQAVQASIADGVTYAVAAGNESADACGSSPAAVPEAITVGATDDADAAADFSNTGECLDIFAPGVDITSAWNDGSTNTISGTSMATPHVAGAAALFLEANPTADPAAVAEGLTGAATPDVVTNPGEGSPNLLLTNLF